MSLGFNATVACEMSKRTVSGLFWSDIWTWITSFFNGEIILWIGVNIYSANFKKYIRARCGHENHRLSCSYQELLLFKKTEMRLEC